jgi:hypothetical protein
VEYLELEPKDTTMLGVGSTKIMCSFTSLAHAFMKTSKLRYRNSIVGARTELKFFIGKY